MEEKYYIEIPNEMYKKSLKDSFKKEYSGKSVIVKFNLPHTIVVFKTLKEAIVLRELLLENFKIKLEILKDKEDNLNSIIKPVESPNVDGSIGFERMGDYVNRLREYSKASKVIADYPLNIYVSVFDSNSLDEDLLSDILSDISLLYRMEGGSGIAFDKIKISKPELVLS